VLRIIFGPERDEVTAGLRKLHNEELHDLYSSLRIIRIVKSRKMRWAGHVAKMGGKRKDLLEIGLDGVDWIFMAQDRDKWKALENAVMNFWILQNAAKLRTGFTTKWALE
jgi:hypothetical protein